MTTTVVKTQTSPLRTRSGSHRNGRRQHRNRSGGERLTLQAKLAGVWEGLLTTGAAECPVCGGAMTRLEGSGSCSGCGSLLS
jgi:hypothetical protein